MTISCHTNVIEAKTKVKYLGATLDQTLSCESMALFIIQKANARLKFLYRKHRYLTFITKKLLVISLIQCYFDYACSFWFAGVSQSLKNKLQTTQNKLITRTSQEILAWKEKIPETSTSCCLPDTYDLNYLI